MTSLSRNSKLNFNSIDLNLNPKDKLFIFHPRKTLLKKGENIISSQSAPNVFNIKENSYNSFNENDKDIRKYNINQNTFYNKSKIPPIYFYRKVQYPYKYNMTSIPEYLIKTNEEKNFINKLESLIKNDNDKKMVNELLHKKEKTKKIKDRYKPDALDVQTILKYRPHLYFNSIKFIKNSNSNKNISKQNNVVNLFKDNEISKNEIKTNEINKNYETDDKQISYEDQIKYKYKISDILGKRNEEVITNKSAEKYLFKKNNNINNTFYTTDKSKSDWVPNRNYGTKMNFFSSVSYNILSPMHKGYNKFIFPSELNKNNLYNECPAFHKVKSISEFADLTKAWSRNNLDAYNKDKDKNKKKNFPNFKFKGSVATDQLNAYHINRDLIPNPT